MWNVHIEQVQVRRLAISKARENLNKDNSFRSWASSHGGVYVPADSRTPPNPRLRNIQERDIITPSGRHLTLMNPAYMTRQLMDEYSKDYGIKGKITSTKFLYEGNAPDEWERKALQAFEKGVEEVYEFTEVDGKSYLRLMSPMIAQKGCLKCHGFQGYKEGDIKGGVGVSVPLEPLLAFYKRQSNALYLSHGLIWILGLVGIGLGTKRLNRSITEHKRAEEQLRHRSHELNERVKELDCIYQASRLMVDPALSLEDVFSGIVNLIPPSWQYPDITCARIIFNGRQFQTHTFMETEWKQSVDISVSSEFKCALEVYYMQEKPDGYEGPFLKEERDLIDTLARDMGKFIERKRAEQEIRKSQVLLAQSEKMSAVGTMVAGVAHELNNPLMGMTNFVQYCQKHTPRDDRKYPVLKDIEHETNRCIDIVRNLLTFSRLEQENGAEYREEDLPVVLDRVLKLLNYRIGANKVNVTTRIAEGIPRVRVKSFKVQQVFLNILVNAMDALQDSEKKDISIDMRPEDESVKITFEDTGPGISSENIGRVFEPFFTTKPPGKGTGLGLSISYGIINEHGGEITAESNAGEGTKINILLPVKSNEG